MTKMRYIINCVGTDHQVRLEIQKGGDKEGGDKEGEEAPPPPPLSSLLVEAEKWRGALSHSVDSSDTLITAQVSGIHI